MSIKGKALASMAMAHRIAGLIINAREQSEKLHPVFGIPLTVQASIDCVMLSRSLNCTPHEHFNSKGQIDKRKVRKYKRKSGFKHHTARLPTPYSDRISSGAMTVLVDKINSTISGPYAVECDSKPPKMYANTGGGDMMEITNHGVISSGDN